jgi:prevent-host-death family protein
MDMSRVTVFDARNDFAEILNRVAYAKERVVITRRDKDVVAIVSIEDLHLIEQLEDRIDLEDAKKVLARNEPTISLDELKAKYGKKPAPRRRQLAKSKAKK